MSNPRGLTPSEFNDGDSEIFNYEFVVGMQKAFNPESGSNGDVEEMIDSLYELGFSPEAVDVIIQTYELNQGSWN